jgi:hypothetical protein
MRSLTALCAAIACLIAAPAAMAATTGPKTETATSGGVTATLTYTMKSAYEASDLKLVVTRDGVPATLEGGSDPAAGCQECQGAFPIGGIGLDGDDTKSLTITDLDGNGENEIIVDTFTGGAHCCSISAIYGWDPATNQYRHLIEYWGDPAYVLKKLGTTPGQELVTYDPRFAYTFCAYVCSAMPLVIYRYENYKLVDVTRDYPAQLRADNRSLEKAIIKTARQKGSVRGLYPALCANLYNLGEGAQCTKTLNTALKRGWLKTEPGDAAAHWSGGKKYIARVEKVLARYGYTK